jgi:HK97 family phage prohead protease
VNRSIILKHVISSMAHKDLPLEACELKFLNSKSDAITFEGYASVWGRKDSYGDTILKGAFTDAIKARRPMMFFGHNPGRVIGKWTSIEEDDKGLLVKGELTPGHRDAQDVAASLKHGAVSGLSIGGYTLRSEDLPDGGRIIKAFDLYEISVVSMPAEDEARIDMASVKSRIDQCHQFKDFEALLCETGAFSRSDATAFVARLRRLSQGEPDGQRRDTGLADELKQLAELMRRTSLPQSLTRS